MAEITKPTKNLHFPQGGGEMGELTRTFDWSKTSIGVPATWPQSLRSMESFLLNSRFPMFLFWGPEHLCFYNDAYRPSLGLNGKHPSILGMPGKEAWPEIWDFIGPKIEAILHGGESIWFEDQLVPINRNGHLENVYWTYSYSPVLGDEGNGGGVMVTCMETTAQVIQRRQAQENEARFRNVIKQAPVAIGLTRGEDFVFERINAPMLQIIHKEQESDVLGKKMIEDVLPELKNQPIHEIMLHVLRTGETFSGIEVPVPLTLDGVLYDGYYNISYTRIVEPDGTFSIMHMALDVTAQVRARKRIEEEAAKLKALVEQTPAPTLVLRGDGFLIEHINEPMLEMMGRREEEVVGRPFLSVMPELEGQFAWEQVKKVYYEGINFDLQEVLVPHKRSGVMQDYYYNVAYRPLKEENRITGMIQVAIDVTGQVSAHQKNEEQAAALRSAVEIAELGTWKMSVESRTIHLSERQAAMLGIAQFSFSIEEGLLFMDEAEREWVAKAYQEALRPESGGRYDNEFRITNAVTGKTHVLRTMGQARFDAVGKLISMEGTSQDVTLQRELQAALEAQVQERTKELAKANQTLHEVNKELQRSNHHLEEFAHAASHDLKEPIRKIQVFSERLKEQLKNKMDAEEIHTFSRITNASQRMGSLVDDLLLYSHVSQHPHKKERVDLSDKVRRVLEDLELDIQEKGAVIQTGELPVVQGYGRQLQQLFQNLISNALKYSKADIPPHITVKATYIEKNGRPYHLLKVADNGIGFDQHYAEQIFQMFSRLHGKQEYEGTGVGLAIVKKIMENHGGLIEVESEISVGSTFSVYLPAQ